MKSIKLFLVLILALCFLTALVLTAPARLLTLVLPQEQVVVQGLSGTLWRGSASRALLRLPPGYLHLGAVNWSLDPFSLLSLAPRLEISSNWGQQRLEGEVIVRGTDALDVLDLQAQVSAGLVQQFAPLAIDGRVSLDLAELSVRDGLPSAASGRLVWLDGGFQSPRGRVPLGSYALSFEQPAGAALRGEVITLSGPLEASGSVELEGRRYAIDLLLSSEFKLDGQLQQALSLMAQPQGSGYRVVLDAEF